MRVCCDFATKGKFYISASNFSVFYVLDSQTCTLKFKIQFFEDGLTPTEDSLIQSD